MKCEIFDLILMALLFNGRFRFLIVAYYWSKPDGLVNFDIKILSTHIK